MATLEAEQNIALVASIGPRSICSVESYIASLRSGLESGAVRLLPSPFALAAVAAAAAAAPVPGRGLDQHRHSPIPQPRRRLAHGQAAASPAGAMHTGLPPGGPAAWEAAGAPASAAAASGSAWDFRHPHSRAPLPGDMPGVDPAACRGPGFVSAVEALTHPPGEFTLEAFGPFSSPGPGSWAPAAGAAAAAPFNSEVASALTAVAGLAVHRELQQAQALAQLGRQYGTGGKPQVPGELQQLSAPARGSSSLWSIQAAGCSGPGSSVFPGSGGSTSPTAQATYTLFQAQAGEGRDIDPYSDSEVPWPFVSAWPAVI